MYLAKVFEPITEPELGEVAKYLVRGLAFPFTMGLVGGLGAGKTTLVRSIMAELGVKSGVASPSFVLCHEYNVTGEKRIEHWDLYRLAAVPLELAEPPAPNIGRIIEWSDKFPELQSELDLCVTLVPISIQVPDTDGPDTDGPNCRQVRIERLALLDSD